MTLCQYRKLALQEPLAVSRRSSRLTTENSGSIAIGSSGGVDLGTLLLAGAGLALVVNLATTKRTFGHGR